MPESMKPGLEMRHWRRPGSTTWPEVLDAAGRSGRLKGSATLTSIMDGRFVQQDYEGDDGMGYRGWGSSATTVC